MAVAELFLTLVSQMYFAAAKEDSDKLRALASLVTVSVFVQILRGCLWKTQQDRPRSSKRQAATKKTPGKGKKSKQPSSPEPPEEQPATQPTSVPEPSQHQSPDMEVDQTHPHGQPPHNPQPGPSGRPRGGPGDHGGGPGGFGPGIFTFGPIDLSRRSARGYMDTPERIQELVLDNPLTIGMVSQAMFCHASQLDGVQLENKTLHLMSLMLSYAKCHRFGRRGEDHVKLCLIGELMAPYIPDGLLSTNADVCVVECAMTLANEETGLYVPEAIFSLNGTDTAVPSAINVVDFDAALAFLYYTRVHVKPVILTYLRDCMIEFYFCVSTRGQATDAKIERFSTNYKEQFGYIPRLSSTRMRLYYQHYGKHITHTNIRPLLETWVKDFPDTALALKLILKQAAFSGLTQLLTIGQALLTFRDFPWSRLHRLFPGEFEAYRTAMRLVDGNPYFGYVRDMKAAASRHYRNLAYAAKELLIRSGGHESLKAYQGWARSCKSQAAVLNMINSYLSKRTAEVGEGVEQVLAGPVSESFDEVDKYRQMVMGETETSA
ncbi:hypothetical protein L798_11875 [Zootermopsis nevadensis]|uniref:Nucleoprotein n=2 Tax=Zootermopsis nevadensis TaxID=136037 RepID=A0A067R557_ZOONE|nr:hypothetical protein L798_11875 [Zootermopsis nevadensis]